MYELASGPSGVAAPVRSGETDAQPPGAESSAAARAASHEQGPEEAARFERVAREQLAFVWRCLRRLGVALSEVDDAAQQVLLVAAAKLGEVPDGRERAFLYATAARVAANARRAAGRRHQAHDGLSALGPGESETPEELSDQLRARALLDRVMADMPDELREVFVLFEIEEFPIQEIAETLAIPIGTVGSRLRRARQAFREAVKRHKARASVRSGEQR